MELSPSPVFNKGASKAHKPKRHFLHNAQVKLTTRLAQILKLHNGRSSMWTRKIRSSDWHTVQYIIRNQQCTFQQLSYSCSIWHLINIFLYLTRNMISFWQLQIISLYTKQVKYNARNSSHWNQNSVPIPSISAYRKKSCTEKSFFLSGWLSTEVDNLPTSCGTNSISSVSETVDRVDRSRSTFDNGMLSKLVWWLCTITTAVNPKAHILQINSPILVASKMGGDVSLLVLGWGYYHPIIHHYLRLTT